MADDEIEANAAADKVKNAFMIFSILRLIETKFSVQLFAEIWRWRWRSCAPFACTLADKTVGNLGLDDWLGGRVDRWRGHRSGAAQVAGQFTIIAQHLWAAIAIHMFGRVAACHRTVSRPCR
ncbi:MAG: hypothetical protein H2056_04370 [Sphingopyxis sp.]|nr:hypothetical protein [Sphingopyxis sp.]